jgi:SAM-dependent methyltransferase
VSSEDQGRGGAPDWQAGHERDLNYHRALLDDVVRLDAYDRAIRRLVRPGDVVLDVGTGTGILALLAARAGAARVHAVESTAVAGLAEELVAANGLGDVITVHRADARTLAPVEPVDLIVSECMGRFLVDDGMIPAIEQARAWLKPAGRCCPREIVLRLAPVGHLYVGALDLWRDDVLGLDLRPALRHALRSAYAAELDPSWLFADPVDYHRWTLPWPAPPFEGTHRFALTQDGELRALAGWFEATLAEGVVLSTEPGSSTHWGQYLFPVPRQPVRAGDEVVFSLRFDAATEHWAWSGEVRRGGATVSTFAGTSEQRLDGGPDSGDFGDVTPPGPEEVGADAAEAANAEGSAAFGEGDFEGAVRAFERAVRAGHGAVTPQRLTDLYENLGLALVHAGRLRAAMRAFLRALDGVLTSREQSLRFLARASQVLGLHRDAERYGGLYRATFGALPWDEA